MERGVEMMVSRVSNLTPRTGKIFLVMFVYIYNIPVGVGLWHSSTGEWGSWKIPPVNIK